MANLLDVGIEHDDAKFIQSGRYYIADKDMVGWKKQEYTINQYFPLASLNTVFQSTGQAVEIKIEGSADRIDIISDLILYMEIKNTGTATAQPNPAPFLLQYYEIWIGDTLVERVDNVSMWYERLLFYSNEEIAARGAAENFDPTTLTATGTIAAGATVKYELRLDNFLTKTPFLVSMLRQPITFRFYWQDNNDAQRASIANTNLVLNALRLYAGGIKFNSLVKSKMMAKFFNQRLVYRFYEYRRIHFDVNLTNGSEISIAIPQFAGNKAAYLIMAVRTNSNFDNQYANLRQLNYFTLLDEGGSPVGLSQNLHELITRDLMPKWFPSLGKRAADTNFYVLNFAEDPQASILKGANSGVEKFHSNFQLVLNSTAASPQDLLLILPTETQLILQSGVVGVNLIP